ncbi:50S ribosomal protein L22 [Candidatus Woesearchaeota archaeon]|nr:50S ribosomal protein L22 [Candidatus Woesearchaeota archaeon]
MGYKYSANTEQNEAKAAGIAMPVSFKQSVEVCSYIRGKGLRASINALNRVVEGLSAVPYRRYNRGGTGHRPGMAAGRYPKNTCTEIIKLLEDVQANAQHKGLNANKLVIRSISAQKAAKQFHYGRKRRTKMKRTHIEVVVKEKND